MEGLQTVLSTVVAFTLGFLGMIAAGILYVEINIRDFLTHLGIAGFYRDIILVGAFIGIVWIILKSIGRFIAVLFFIILISPLVIHILQSFHGGVSTAGEGGFSF